MTMSDETCTDGTETMRRESTLMGFTGGLLFAAAIGSAWYGAYFVTIVASFGPLMLFYFELRRYLDMDTDR